MGTVLVPYRGDLVSARLSYKAAKKKSLRKFKRDLLKVWDMTGRLYLWTDSQGYVNDDARDILGIEEDFMDGASGLTGFGVELKASADVDKIIDLDDEQKDFLRLKCISIFSKYGRTVKTSYKDGGYDFATFKDGVETEYDGAEDEELAAILYDRMVMYMVANDSTDTVDSWNNIYATSDFFNGTIQSKLKSYTTTFTDAQILQMVNDRLFTKRTYNTIGGGSLFKSDAAYAVGVDMVLFNELLDGGTTDNVDSRYWDWDGSSYTLKVDVVRNLDEQEFLIFMQTHLGTFTTKPKKKWYQKGFFGIVFAVIIVTIAVITQQYYLIGVGLGTALVVAGTIISITGALLGNEVMMIAGQIVSIVGGGINFYDSLMTPQLAVDAAKNELMRWGADAATIKAATHGLLNEMINDMALDIALGAGKFAFSTYSTISSIIDANVELELGETTTPREKINELYICDDISWDFVQQFMPEYIINSTMKIM